MSERYRAGIDTLLALSRDKADVVSDALAAEAPEFVRLLIECVFADLFAREGLDRRARLFVAIGALAARGGAPAQLRWFVRAALEAGAERGEVIEALMQVAAFAGYASAATALEECADLLVDQAEAGCTCPTGIAAR
jgi:4-carboxymuconolactone decarboxylase